jgi:hypothetical protein
MPYDYVRASFVMQDGLALEDGSIVFRLTEDGRERGLSWRSNNSGSSAENRGAPRPKGPPCAAARKPMAAIDITN